MTYFVIVLLISIFLAVIWLNLKLNELKTQNKPDSTLLEWAKSTQLSLNNLSREIGQMSEIGRSMKDLQEFLKSPKLRGEIGEEVLSDLIGQMFPKNNFFLQYSFRSGVKVDAAIKTEAGILPIDSKFSLENFQKMAKGETEEIRKDARRDFIRDVKRHIETIASKYILPAEGTMNFALMYIPSETVFYEIAQEAELTNFARKQRVYPVSPSTLYAHLQMILLSFEGKRLETKSKQIFQLLHAIKGDYEKMENNLSVLGKHLNNAYSQMGNVNTSFLSLGQKISSSEQLNQPQESAKPLP